MLADYSEAVIASRILRVLTLLAVIAASLAMPGAERAMAMPHSTISAQGHCSDMRDAPDDPRAGAVCAKACTAAMPAFFAGSLAAAALPAASPEPTPLKWLGAGVVAEVTPPPPRSFLTI